MLRLNLLHRIPLCKKSIVNGNTRKHTGKVKPLGFILPQDNDQKTILQNYPRYVINIKV